MRPLVTCTLTLLLVLSTTRELCAQQGYPGPAASRFDCSGMYTFLQEGEFVQIAVEDGGRVTGYISRFSQAGKDHSAFVDQLFKEGKLDGRNLSFSTQTVEGVSYGFKGTVERGEGKNPGDESYYIVKGTLTESHTAAGKKTATKSREVVFRSFPQDLDSPAKNN